MATKRQKALQVLTPEGWKYVFCYNTWDPRGPIITTKRREAALTGNDLPFFQSKFGNTEFRATLD